MTGPYANYGLSEKYGAELAVKEINEAGGINGKQIELSYQDSQGESESAVNAYGKLMDWGMNISLGGVLSGETASIVAAAVMTMSCCLPPPAPPISASMATASPSAFASMIASRALPPPSTSRIMTSLIPLVSCIRAMSTTPSVFTMPL